MTDKEVNKIIAEFIKDNDSYIIDECASCQRSQSYVGSLDALVLVWEKLGVTHTRYEANYGRYFQVVIDEGHSEKIRSEESTVNSTIQQAAAHATAKAILELKDER